MPKDQRVKEAETLIEKLNDEFVEQSYSNNELGKRVDEVVTSYIAALTGQRIETSSRIRKTGVIPYLLPIAEGFTDPFGGEVWVPNKKKVRRPHIVAHEFCHRKGYRQELEVQILAYFALRTSEDPIFRQAAYAERLYRTLDSLSQSEQSSVLEQHPVREELKEDICDTPKLNPLQLAVLIPFSGLYLLKMKKTNQTGGFKDYGEGLINFIHTVGDKID